MAIFFFGESPATTGIEVPFDDFGALVVVAGTGRSRVSISSLMVLGGASIILHRPSKFDPSSIIR